MKKGIVIAISIVVLALLCLLGAALTGIVPLSQGFRPPRDAQNLTVTGDTEMLRTVSVPDLETIGMAVALLENGVKADPEPSVPSSLMRLRLYSPPETEEYEILEEDGRLFVRRGDMIRELNPAGFYALADALGPDLYAYAVPDEVSIVSNGGQALPVISLEPLSGTYAYLGIDGAFHQAEVAALSGPDYPVLSLRPGEWSYYLPNIDGAEESLSLLKDGKTVYSGGWEEMADYQPEESGSYTAKLSVIYTGPYRQGELIYHFEVEYDLGISFELRGEDTFPGELVVLHAYGIPEGQAVQFDSDVPFTPNFFDDGTGGQIALLPVSYFNGPGDYRVTLGCAGTSQSFVVTVNDKEFEIQDLEVDAETTEETINSAQANAEYEQVIAPLRTVADPVKHWDGQCVLPVEDARVTTEFGMIRYTNGMPTSSRHGAIDLAAPLGTPVAATNSGNVLYAGFLQLTGNTVLIEHGFGLKSWYYHMDSLDVSTGDMVEKGGKIGEVGSTGFSTGPHLHFGMSVNNVYINPEPLIETDLIAAIHVKS